jgi:hypothetical protein
MVEKSEFKDHAELGRDPEIVTMLDKSRNGIFKLLFRVIERIVFSGKVIKYNRFGMKQDRTILLTNLNLYNIKKKSNHLNMIMMLFSVPEKDTYTEAKGSDYVDDPRELRICRARKNRIRL